MNYFKFLITINLLCYTISLSAQLAYETKFLGGTKYYFKNEHIKKSQVKELYKQYSQEAYKEFQKGKDVATAAMVVTSLPLAYSIISFGVNIGNNYGEYKLNPYDLIAIPPAIIGAILFSISEDHYGSAVNLFNARPSRETRIHLKPVISLNGAGIVLVF